MARLWHVLSSVTISHLPESAMRQRIFPLTAAVLACLVISAQSASADDGDTAKVKRLPTINVQVELVGKAPTPTAKQIHPYTDALGVYIYKVQKVRWGKLDPDVDRIAVTHWVVYRKHPQKITRKRLKKRMRLTITPFRNVKDRYQTVYRSEHEDALTLPLFHDLNQKIEPPPGEKTRWNYGVDLSGMFPIFFELKDQLRLVALGDCQAWFANKAQNFMGKSNLETPVALSMCQQRSGLPFQKLMIENYLIHLPELDWVVLTWNPRFVSAAWTEHGAKAKRFTESPGFAHDRENAKTLWKSDEKEKKAITTEQIRRRPDLASVWRNRPWGWLYLAPDRHRFGPRGEVLRAQKKLGQYKFVPERWKVFEEIVEILSEQEIKLLVYTTPIHPETANQKVKDKMGTDAAGYQDQVRRMGELQKKYPKTLFFYDLNNMGDNGLEDKDFENIDHVSASGAEKVSRRVEAFRRKVEAKLGKKD
jgi:hypothetical protein